MTDARYSPPIVADTVTATIASSDTVSGEVNVYGTTLCGLHLPASFTGTALTFQAAVASGGTYQEVYKDGAALSVTVAQAKYIALNPADFAGIQYLKIVSGSAEAAERIITLATRPV